MSDEVGGHASCEKSGLRIELRGVFLSWKTWKERELQAFCRERERENIVNVCRVEVQLVGREGSRSWGKRVEVAEVTNRIESA
jgi:hypothetical protein